MDTKQRDIPQKEDKKQGRQVIRNAKLIELGGVMIPSADAGGIGLGASVGTASRAFGLMRSYSFSTASDERLKKDIEELPYGLEHIEALRPVAYKFKKGEDVVKLGFIAQEVKEILPEVVDGSEETNYGVHYDDVIPVLVKAVQELSARVRQLEAGVL